MAELETEKSVKFQYQTYSSMLNWISSLWPSPSLYALILHAPKIDIYVRSVLSRLQGQSYGDTLDAHKFVFNLGAFVGDLTLEEEAGRYDSLMLFMWFFFSSYIINRMERLVEKMELKFWKTERNGLSEIRSSIVTIVAIGLNEFLCCSMDLWMIEYMPLFCLFCSLIW